MTKLLIRVADAEQAEAAIAGGADLVVFSGEVRDRSGAIAYRIVNGAGAARDVRTIARVTSADAMAEAGHSGAMLDADARLLDRLAVAEIASFIRRCRERGLEAWLSGGLEAPDVPRLLPLKPDVLCFEDGSLALLRGLIPRGDATPLALDRGHGEFDKLFVHDLVLSISVGAYAREHAKPQRVRFNVDAEIARPNAPARDLRDVFSYDVIADTIRRVAAEGHVELLETLAERVAAELLAHPTIVRLTLKLEKLDIGPAIVGIEIVRERGGHQ